MALQCESDSIHNLSDDSISIDFIYGKDEKTDRVQIYYTNENVLDKEYSFVLKENKPVSILFKSKDKNSRLYMYGLESLMDENLEVDEDGNVYLKPSENSVALFQKDFYPLIPGMYLGKVITEGSSYYLPFAVRPKQVTEDQLYLMKKDLESHMRGLAIDFVKKIFSPVESETKALPPQLLRQFMTIKRHYPTVMAALTDIYKKANYRIRKQYRWIKENRLNKIDHVTLRMQQTKSPYEGHLFAPFNATDYDLPENRWVKFIIRNVLSLLDQFVESVNTHIQSSHRELEELKRYEFQESTRREIAEKKQVLSFLEDYMNIVHKMKIGFQMIVHAPWYEEIKEKAFTHIPHNLLSDSRYRALFQLHRDLKTEELEVFIDPAFLYQWKRTDKLYEMWGYFQILELLIDFGFNPVAGWFFDRDADDETLLIPILPSGERIILIKEDLRIHYVYDGVLPLASSKTRLESAPLYMGKNNRPDGRIDFYKRDVYVGTLMIDFKYRPVSNFWNNSLYNSIFRTREMEQLIAYKRDSNSKYLYGEEAGKRIRELHSPRPVREVWGLYAESRSEFQNDMYLRDDSIRIMPMNPGHDSSCLKEKLKEIILIMDGMLEIIT